MDKSPTKTAGENLAARAPGGILGLWALAGLCLAGVGCRCARMPPTNMMAPVDAPRELSKVTLPPYKIEPPDILQIEAVVLELNDKGERLETSQPKSLWPQPITGQFLVKPDGTVELGV